jgi:S1-C subfamily serine protease
MFSHLSIGRGSMVKLMATVFLSTALLLASLPTPLAAATRGDDAVRSAKEIYQEISPAIPYVATPMGSGSGVLVRLGNAQYVLTNSHVVWPYPWAEVYFPATEERMEVEVYDWDLVADMALLGPVDVDIKPVAFPRRLTAEIGDEVYQIGYPAEVDYAPTPTLTRGVVSRFRTWENAGLTYLQSDAAITGGQSGGALIAADGTLLGLTTFHYEVFSLAVSVSDVRQRAAQMIRGEDADRLGVRGRLLDDVDDDNSISVGKYRHGLLDFFGDMDRFFVELEKDQEIIVWAESFIAIDPQLAIGPSNGHEGDLSWSVAYSYLPTEAEIYFKAPETGEYVIMIGDVYYGDADSTNQGSYIIGVKEYKEYEEDVEWH